MRVTTFKLVVTPCAVRGTVEPFPNRPRKPLSYLLRRGCPKVAKPAGQSVAAPYGLLHLTGEWDTRAY